MRTLENIDPDAVVCDTYTLSSPFMERLRRKWRTLAIVDGSSGTAHGDVIVDPNLGAESLGHSVADGKLLAGVGFALIRDDVRALRPVVAPTGRRTNGTAPRVLVVMGGTDAYATTPIVLQAIAMTQLACSVTAISRLSKRDLTLNEHTSGQSLQILKPTSAFAKLVVGADLVVSAAGSSTWEIFTLGTCAALVQVAENQALGYRESVARRFAAGLGSAHVLGTPAGLAAASETLASLLTSAPMRGQLSAKAWEGVDGHGRERVADELLAGLR